MADWTLEPGQKIKRTELHTTYGGGRQGGISPCKTSPNVLIFSEPSAGKKHGYTDGWQADGCFHYTGEGQRRDQRMIKGNAAILNYREAGRTLRVFQGVRGIVTYMGAFELDSDQPYYTAQAPETGGGPLRRVFVFRLRPTDGPSYLSSPLAPPADVLQVSEVPVEATLTEHFVMSPGTEPVAAARRESQLVRDFCAYMARQGHVATRLNIVPPGETSSLYTDLFFKDLNLLIEAKGVSSREVMRMAIGQLLDYGRFCLAARRAVLVPSKPRPDLIALAHSARIDVWWEESGAFECARFDDHSSTTSTLM